MDFTPSHPSDGQSADSAEKRPILAIDVDGVISLFGFEEPPAPEVARWELIDGTVYCLSIAASERLLRLADHFELVWATGWQDRANDRLSLLTGIGPLPVIEFDAHRATGQASGTTNAHWKLGAVDEFCGKRPVAWIDDSFDRSCYEWADRRESEGVPTLLVPTEPAIGFEEAHAEVLAEWARSLSDRSITASSSGERPDHLH